MILASNHISKAFADETVLSDAVFHINEGERAAIVGINGAEQNNTAANHCR